MNAPFSDGRPETDYDLVGADMVELLTKNIKAQGLPCAVTMRDIPSAARAEALRSSIVRGIERIESEMAAKMKSVKVRVVSQEQERGGPWLVRLSLEKRAPSIVVP